MIPKIIHYCWFGRGPKPPLANKCIASWKKFCPGYTIIEWNEDNYNTEHHPYAAWCLENKKYAFLSDYVRLQVIQEQGGVYFDTDVELVKNIDSFLQFPAFFAFENDKYVASGLGFGAEPNHITVRKMLDQYEGLEQNSNGGFAPIGCPTLNTRALVSLGLQCNGRRQTVAGAEILPADFMNPYDDATGRLNQTDNTVSIHWYMKSALGKAVILRSKIMRPIHRVFGIEIFRIFRKGRANE